MALGGLMGLLGVPLPGVEIGIALLAAVLGAVVLFEVRPPMWVAALIVTFFAVFHGHAYGRELPAGTSALLYSLGFVIATGLLHAAGILLGVARRRLVMGRASEGLGGTDLALLQAAALALVAGEGGGPNDQINKVFALDKLSVRQTEDDVRDTVVARGKQLSRRWYVGYERGLKATTGNFQLIYRIAQRFTLRAQSGEDNSVDLISIWRCQ